MSYFSFTYIHSLNLAQLQHAVRSLALVGLLVSGAALAEPIEAPKAGDARSASQWRNAAIQDIEAAYRITIDNHPGAFDPANPGFLKNLASARENGLALAAKVTNVAGYMAAIQRFNASMNDGHAGAFTDIPPDDALPERWPGFVTAWRGDALLVYAAEAGGPPVGARVTACDGKPIKDVIADNVFAFRGRIDEPGRWWTQAKFVFFDQGNPFIKLPQRCQFVVGKDVQERTLAWTPVTAQAISWRTQSYNGTSLPVGLTEPRAKLFWAAMPSFQPNESERDAYRAMIEEIAAHRQRYLDADAIVVDLRQNQGGSSTWSRDFAFALWGMDRVERRSNAYSAKTEIWWRASADNVKYMTGLVDVLLREKQTSSAEWARANSVAMQAALARGDKFYVERVDAEMPQVENPNDDTSSDPPPFIKPMYVIVPGQCASACLDALDVFTRFPNTVLIGAPSSADSTYMEVRTQKINSGMTSVIIPNKLYRNRPRANGQAYIPAIVVDNLSWSTDAFLKVVEADLKKAAHL